MIRDGGRQLLGCGYGMEVPGQIQPHWPTPYREIAGMGTGAGDENGVELFGDLSQWVVTLNDGTTLELRADGYSEEHGQFVFSTLAKGV